MPLVRMIVAVRDNVMTAPKESVVNTLYFNVSGSVDPPDYQKLVDDLWFQWSIQTWAVGRYIDVRAYNMGDVEPRPQKAKKAASAQGTATSGVPQVALCLSYYADRNLAGKRGRIYLGPWSTGSVRPSEPQMQQALGLVDSLAGLGGVNVDWSLYSPKTNTNTRISNAWVDNSWDIIRHRKLPGTARISKTLNG